jgi:hypothetical protein
VANPSSYPHWASTGFTYPHISCVETVYKTRRLVGGHMISMTPPKATQAEQALSTRQEAGNSDFSLLIQNGTNVNGILTLRHQVIISLQFIFVAYLLFSMKDALRGA